MRKRRQRVTLINCLLGSLPIFYLFVLWEGGRFNAVTLSNSSFLLALALSIIATFQWLLRERVFAFFIDCCKRFFFKGNWKNKEYKKKEPRISQYLGYPFLIAIIYYCLSFVLLIF